MAADQVNGNVSILASHPTCMESVNRISKLPVVESTIQTATNLYEKVKVYYWLYFFVHEFVLV